MSYDVKELANAVAEELAVEHCSFYRDRAPNKAVKGFFLNQLYRSWGHTAHREWSRLLLDRRSLVQVPHAPRRWARADDRYYEENIMESYFHPGVEHVTTLTRTRSVLGVRVPRCRTEGIRFCPAVKISCQYLNCASSAYHFTFPSMILISHTKANALHLLKKMVCT